MPPIFLLGEAYGEAEALIQHPFVGPSGIELLRMLADAKIIEFTPEDRDLIRSSYYSPTPTHGAFLIQKVWKNHPEVYTTNVFNLRPNDKNDIEALCTDKSGDHLNLPAIRPGKFIRTEFLRELDRLSAELASASPNLVIALGGTATWYLLRNSGISKIRGTITSSWDGKYKVLPVYHPAAVLREWSLRPVTVLDLIKARREAGYRDIRRPERTIYIDPDLNDLEWFWREHLVSAKYISFDIETRGTEITCIGFAPSPKIAIVIPFVDNRKPGGSYWADAATEGRAWDFVRRVMTCRVPKIAQNALYDMRFLWQQYGIPTIEFEDDTMLLHHALQPESEKGLGFLGSVYTNEASWKLMRLRGKETIKREE